MADSKISDLASLTTPATADLIEVVDVSDTLMAGTGTNKKITVGLLAPLAGLADPNADRIPFWDDSAGAYAYLTAGSGLTITGTTMTASGGGGGASSPLTLTATTASEIPLVTKGAASQTGHLFEAQDSAGTVIFQIDADGAVRRNDGTNLVLRSAANLDFYCGNVHQYRMANSSSIGISTMLDNDRPLGSTSARWSNVFGTYHTVCGNTAPADADIAANQLMLWFDSSDGAAKLKLKAKSANGTVVAGERPVT